MTAFRSIEELRQACLSLPRGDEQAAKAAAARQDVLTKPQGSLGRLEEIAIHMARWQGRPLPTLGKVEAIVFAGSHGVTKRGVSAYPTEVTAQMVANFAAGGAAINQLARAAKAELKVIPLNIDKPTEDFTEAAAMDEADFLSALSIGHEAVSRDADLLCLGEMGIGNTTAAAAVAAALFGGSGTEWVGRGTGVDVAGLRRKAEVVDMALAFHGERLRDPLAALARVGGRELAAIFGAALAARQNGIPIILDGFVSTAAAAPLARAVDGGLAHALAGHVSAEAGHKRLLAHLEMEPLLSLGMRLGEGSGACLAVNLVRSALECHAGMASFAEAGVSTKDA